MALISLRSEFRGNLSDSDDDGWRVAWRWHTSAGVVDLWNRLDRPSFSSPVRVTGEVPHAVADDLWMLGQKVWLTTALDGMKYIASAQPLVDEHDVNFAMPRHGFLRRARRISVSLDGTEYVAGARAFASVQLTRPDHAPVWRTRPFGSDLVADATAGTAAG